MSFLYIKLCWCGSCDSLSPNLLRIGQRISNHCAKMRVLQSIQADCALLGIHTDESSKKRDLNAKSWITFSLYVLGTLSSGYYFICVDKSFEQYIQSYNTHTSFLVCILQFINLFLQMPKLTDFFLTMSDFVQQRKHFFQFSMSFIHLNVEAIVSTYFFFSMIRTKLLRIGWHLQQSHQNGWALLSNHLLSFHKSINSEFNIALIHR